MRVSARLGELVLIRRLELLCQNGPSRNGTGLPAAVPGLKHATCGGTCVLYILPEVGHAG